MGSCSSSSVAVEREDLPEERTIRLTREGDQPVGLDLDFMDQKTGLVLEVLEGAVRASRAKINPGERIVAVNGDKGALQIMKHLKEDTELDMLVEVPKEFQVQLTKGKSLGIDFTHAPKGMSLLILKVLGNGAVREWNDANPGAMIKACDRIVQVNGCRGGWSKLISQIQESELLTLVISPGPASRGAARSPREPEAGGERA